MNSICKFSVALLLLVAPLGAGAGECMKVLDTMGKVTRITLRGPSAAIYGSKEIQVEIRPGEHSSANSIRLALNSTDPNDKAVADLAQTAFLSGLPVHVYGAYNCEITELMPIIAGSNLIQFSVSRQ